MTKTTNPAKESLLKEQQEQRANTSKKKDGSLPDALEDTFPASDPISAQAPTKSGARKHS